MAQIKQAAKVQSKIAALVYGSKFSGKTTFALSMAYLKNPDGSPFKILLIDSEQGSADDQFEILEQNGINLNNILVVYTQSLEESRAFIKKATDQTPWYEDEEETTPILDGDGKPFVPNAIILDGSTVLKAVAVQALTDMSRRRANVRCRTKGLSGDEKFVAISTAGLELRDYSTLNNQGMGLVLDLCASSLHYVITAREKQETVQREINGKSESINTNNYVIDSLKGIDYNVKTVMRMFRSENDPDLVCMNVEKDRTRVFNIGIVEDPSLVVYQDKIDSTKNHTAFVPKNTMQEAVKAEGDLFAKSIGAVDESMDEEKQNDENHNDVDTASIIAEIKFKREKLTPVTKEKFKKGLKAAGLPVKIDNMSAEELSEYLDVLNNSI